MENNNRKQHWKETQTYKEFKQDKGNGFIIPRKDFNPMLFDFQKDVIAWTLKKEKNANI